jgi:hypothetical protein
LKKKKETNNDLAKDRDKPSQFEALHKHLDKNDLTNQINPFQTAFANYRRDTSPDASLWDMANSNAVKSSKLDKFINAKTASKEPTD